MRVDIRKMLLCASGGVVEYLQLGFQEDHPVLQSLEVRGLEVKTLVLLNVAHPPFCESLNVLVVEEVYVEVPKGHEDDVDHYNERDENEDQEGDDADDRHCCERQL